MDGTEVSADQAAGAAPQKRVVNLPLRLPPATHDALRRIAYERRVSLHALLLEGVAEVLRKHGN
jgi:hypothetical protein